METVETNMVYFDPTGTGMSADDFTERLGERGVWAMTSGPSAIRFVTHLDVTREDTDLALDAIRDIAV